MKVLYVSRQFTPHDRRFLKAILAQGHVAWTHFEQEGESSDPQVPAWDGSSLPDVLHIGPLGQFSARFLNEMHHRNPHVPVVGMSWAFDVLYEAQKDPATLQGILSSLDQIDALVTDCEAVETRISELGAAKRFSFVRFPWGLELERFRNLPAEPSAELRARLGWQRQQVLISTRAWEPLYRIPNLLQAFADVLRKEPSVRLILIGDGSQRAQIRDQIHQLGLEWAVHLPGKVEEASLPLWFGAADLSVSSSICDGTSLSLLEAMACGKPVIAHRGGGNPEWIRSESNGWLADCERPHDIATAIQVGLSRQERWAEMGAANRAQVFERADWSKNSRLISDAYQLAVRSKQ